VESELELAVLGLEPGLEEALEPVPLAADETIDLTTRSTRIRSKCVSPGEETKTLSRATEEARAREPD
jgi:hypothetical protein